MAIESTIVRGIIAYLNTIEGCICEKIMGHSASSGRADINGCYKGRAFKIEAKTPDHRNMPTKRQVFYLKQWYTAGAVTIVAYSLRFVKAVFDDPTFWAYSEHDAYMQLKEENNVYSWASAGGLKRKEHSDG